MHESLLVVQLDRAVQDVDLNFGPQGVRDLRLIGYQLLPAGQFDPNVPLPPFFFHFENQNNETVIGNLGERVPLFFGRDLRHGWMPPEGIPVSGPGVWTPNRQLRFRVENPDHSPAAFTTLWLMFHYKPEPFYVQKVTSLELNLRQG